MVVDATIIISAVFGACIGPVLAAIAAVRVTCQPIDVDVDAERRLLVAAIADPAVVDFAATTAGVSVDHFSSAARRRRWQRCLDVHRELASPVTYTIDDERAARVADTAAIVAAVADARTMYRGAHNVTEHPATGELHRMFHAPSVARRVVAGGVCAAGFAAAAVAARSLASPARSDLVVSSPTPSPTPSAVTVCAFVALAVAAAAGYVLAAIDHDTLSVDYLTVVVGGAVSSIAAIVLAVLADDVDRLVAGVSVACFWWCVFGGVNLVSRLFAGVAGIGGGDYKIVAVTASIPAMVAGSFFVGFYAVVVGLIAALAVGVVRLAVGRVETTTPVAMAPYLAAGWPIAWLYVATEGLL